MCGLKNTLSEQQATMSRQYFQIRQLEAALHAMTDEKVGGPQPTGT